MPLYQIADLLVDMDASGLTKKRAQPYLVADNADKKPDVTINIPANTLSQYFPEALLSDSQRMYSATGSLFYTALTSHHGMLLHSSCVVLDGAAYLFSAPSGTGKSTHARLWLKHFGKRAYILNDDKPALRIIDNEVYVYGTPWSGKHPLNRNERVKLQGVCILSRAEKNRITLMQPEEALYSLLAQTVRKLDAGSMGRMLDVLQQIVANCKVCRLECNMEEEAAQIAYDFLSAKE